MMFLNLLMIIKEGLRLEIPNFEYFSLALRSATYNGMNLSWDFRNLVSIGNNTFVYDGLGRRISKNNINFTYDSDNRLIKQSNGLEFFYDNTGVAGFIYQSNIYIYRKNLLGDITDIIDNNGNIIVKYVYDAWGNHTPSEEDKNNEIWNVNPFRYRSYYYDVETKLYYLESRYYDPETGRFINSSDLSGLGRLDAEYNLFKYLDNPTSCNTPNAGSTLQYRNRANRFGKFGNTKFQSYHGAENPIVSALDAYSNIAGMPSLFLWSVQNYNYIEYVMNIHGMKYIDVMTELYSSHYMQGISQGISYAAIALSSCNI